jgi:hypothetical protein
VKKSRKMANAFADANAFIDHEVELLQNKIVE